MAKQPKKLLDNAYLQIIKVVSSNYFFYVVLLIAALQALWYVFSIQPGINDEGRHFSNIVIYSHHWSPFLGKQNPAWDHLGEIVRDGSFMFYYVMSWPLRLIRLFTENQVHQLIGLRLVCMAVFIGGLALFRKALLEVGKAPKSVLHLVFLFFVITPTVAILPATVNYDNLVFLLFALVLLLSVRVVKSASVSFANIASILIAGLLMTVVKWASIALFAPIILYVCYDLYEKHKLKALPLLLQSARKLPRHQLPLLVAGLVMAAGLFIERPVVNTIKYGNPEPACQSVISAQRCMQFPDYVTYANVEANKPVGFLPEDPVRYFLASWEPKMADTASNLLERGAVSEIPVAVALYDVLALAGIVLVLICLRDFWRSKVHQLLLTVMVLYTAFLVMDEYMSYVKYGVPAAVRARYLIPVLPIFIYFAALSLTYLLGRYKKALLTSVIVLLLLCTQGGSIITFSLTTPENLYWQSSKTEDFNNTLRNIFRPLVVKRHTVKAITHDL